MRRNHLSTYNMRGLFHSPLIQNFENENAQTEFEINSDMTLDKTFELHKKNKVEKIPFKVNKKLRGKSIN